MGLEGRHVIVIVVYCRYNIEDQYIIFKYSSFHTIIKPVCRSECAYSVYFIGGHIENIHDIIYVIHIQAIRKTIWPILSGYRKPYGPTDFRFRAPQMRLTSNLFYTKIYLLAIEKVSRSILYGNLYITYDMDHMIWSIWSRF